MRFFTEFLRLFERYQFARQLDKELDTKITFRRDNDVGTRYTQDLGVSGDDFVERIKAQLAQAKPFVIEEGVKRMLILTRVPKNNKGLFLPFSTIFIDVDFKQEELANLGVNVPYKRIIGVLVSKSVLTTQEDKEIGESLAISIVSEQHDTKQPYWFDTFTTDISLYSEYSGYALHHEPCPATSVEVKDFLHNFILAFLNFLNNPEIEIVVSKHSDERNAKRMRRGKAALPEESVVKVTGVLKKYIDQLKTEGHFELSYRFWVRGHFRTLRDERWKKSIGKRVWVPPFIKGKGVLVEKEYNLITGGEKREQAEQTIADETN